MSVRRPTVRESAIPIWRLNFRDYSRRARVRRSSIDFNGTGIIQIELQGSYGRELGAGVDAAVLPRVNSKMEDMGHGAAEMLAPQEIGSIVPLEDGSIQPDLDPLWI
ncbi:hypothetical protein HN011_004359 [Eciton burchellii]|nr:hypothetical protein HN011_004359 [Eciton burchellii]